MTRHRTLKRLNKCEMRRENTKLTNQPISVAFEPDMGPLEKYMVMILWSGKLRLSPS